MNAPQWDRLKAVFEQAIDQPAAERTAFVERSCAGDPGLRAEVDGLLQAHDAAGAFLDTAVAGQELQALAGPDLVGQSVGPYRILAEIGRGGMGSVYRARREDEHYLKDVALKLVPGVLGSRVLAGRFRQERTILGRLEHANIARLLDGGTTSQGQPYFAMEFVEGHPLDRYCSEERLAPPARLALFRVVCGAVAYAHRSLVIHRDLKPNNILVTPAGQPKLLDFGIAKLLAPDETGPLEQTLTGMRLMTPEYASPEQVRASGITTATDVYALGVILYQLLTGRRPYELATRSSEELARVICHEQPPAPSQALTLQTTQAAGLGSDLARLRRQLAGDLDTIVMKALHKEPDRRYTSVDDLSEDLRRYVAGLPVAARRDSVGYRVSKFVGRNRTLVLLAAAALAAVLAGLGAALQQAQIARRNQARAESSAREARRLANSLVFELDDAMMEVPGNTRARALLLRRTSEMLDALAADAPADPVLSEELAEAYHRLADALGSETRPSLGDGAGSATAHRKGLALRQSLAAEFPADAERQAGLAESYMMASQFAGPSESSSLLRDAERAVSIARTLPQVAPDALRRRVLLGRALLQLGIRQLGAASLEPARASFAESLDTFEQVLAADPAIPRVRRWVAVAHKRLAWTLMKLGRAAEAHAEYARSLPLDEERLARDASSVEARFDLSVSLAGLAMTSDLHSHGPEAIANYRRALDLREQLHLADSSNAKARWGVTSLAYRLGGAYHELHDDRAAVEVYDRGLRLLASTPGDSEGRADLHRGMSEALASQRRWGPALEHARRAVELDTALLAEHPASWVSKIDLAQAQLLVGDALFHGPGHQRTAAAQAYRGALRLIDEVDAAGQLAGTDRQILDQARAALKRADLPTTTPAAPAGG